MLDDDEYEVETDDEVPERFPFWTKGELTRIGLIASLALLPLSISAVESHMRVPHSEPRAAVSVPRGQLRAVRVVDFDMAKFGMTSMADADDEPAH